MLEDDGGAVATMKWRRKIADLMTRDRAKALDASVTAIDLYPDDPGLQALHGQLLVSLRLPIEAESYLSRALKQSPGDTQAILTLARLYTEQGRLSEAAGVIESAAQIADNIEFLARKGGRLLMENGDPHAAMRVLEAMPTSAWTHELHALYAEARDRQAQDLANGLSPPGRRRLQAGQELLRERKAAEAETLFEGLVADFPQSADAWVGLRGALEAQGRPTEAAAVAQRWIRISPASASLAGFVMSRRLSARGLVFDPRQPRLLRSKESALSKVDDRADLKSSDSAWLPLDPGGQPVTFGPAIAMGGELDGFELSYETGGTFVAALSHAALVGRGVVLTAEGDIISDLNAHHNPAKYGGVRKKDQITFDPRAFKEGMCRVRYFDTPAFLLCGPSDNSFGDWMVNMAPRLALAEAAGLDCPVLIRRHPLPQAVEMLQAMGVPRERILLHDADGISVFRKLYVPSWPMKDRDTAMADLFGAVRRAAPPRPAGPGRLLYLTREDASVRRLVNESQVRERFEARGFEVVRPERLTFDEMRTLFASAACVAGPYGSAWLNMAYGDGQAACLVMTPPYYPGFRREVTMWLGNMGLRFGLLPGALIAGVDYQANPQTAPWTMPLDLIDSAIGRVLDAASEPVGSSVQGRS